MLYNYNVFKTLLYFRWRKKCQIDLKKLEVLARALLFQNCANIIDFIKTIIFSQDFLHRHRKSEKDFTRKRKPPFPTLIIFLIDLATGSYQNELKPFLSHFDSLRSPHEVHYKSRPGKSHKSQNQVFLQCVYRT